MITHKTISGSEMTTTYEPQPGDELAAVKQYLEIASLTNPRNGIFFNNAAIALKCFLDRGFSESASKELVKTFLNLEV
jgi:hypothetical protein